MEAAVNSVSISRSWVEMMLNVVIVDEGKAEVNNRQRDWCYATAIFLSRKLDN